MRVSRKWLKINSGEPGQTCEESNSEFYIELRWQFGVHAVDQSFCRFCEADARSWPSFLLRNSRISAELFREEGSRTGHVADIASWNGGKLAGLWVKLRVLMETSSCTPSGTQVAWGVTYTSSQYGPPCACRGISLCNLKQDKWFWAGFLPVSLLSRASVCFGQHMCFYCLYAREHMHIEYFGFVMGVLIQIHISLISVTLTFIHWLLTSELFK